MKLVPVSLVLVVVAILLRDVLKTTHLIFLSKNFKGEPINIQLARDNLELTRFQINLADLLLEIIPVRLVAIDPPHRSPARGWCKTTLLPPELVLSAHRKPLVALKRPPDFLAHPDFVRESKHLRGLIKGPEYQKFQSLQLPHLRSAVGLAHLPQPLLRS